MNLSNKIKLTKDMNTQVKADKLSITLSLACMIHCLLMPSFLILTSGFLALSIDNEFIHKVFLIFDRNYKKLKNLTYDLFIIYF